MISLPITFLKAVEFYPPVRHQPGQTPRRVRERQSAPLAFGARPVFSAAGSFPPHCPATRPRTYVNSTNRL